MIPIITSMCQKFMMKYSETYQRKVSLLIDILSLIDWGSGFALKGGTAINLFIKNLPRLSVDIDLAFLPFIDRQQDLIKIESLFLQLAKRLKEAGLSGIPHLNNGTKTITSMLVNNRFEQINVEANFIAKGALLPPQLLSLCASAESEFEKQSEVLCLNKQEVYAGKMNAFLSRQHPRDIFDMMEYIKEQSIADIMDVVMIYILQNNRPFHELINPNEIDISDAYQHSFAGMTRETVSLNNLLEARTMILSQFKNNVSAKHIEFFISCLRGNPQWNAFNFEIKTLPGVVWRMLNIEKMPRHKNEEEIELLLKLVP